MAQCRVQSRCARTEQHPWIIILVRLLAQKQLIHEHPTGIHIALHAWLAPIQCLRGLEVLGPACQTQLLQESQGAQLSYGRTQSSQWTQRSQKTDPVQSVHEARAVNGPMWGNKQYTISACIT